MYPHECFFTSVVQELCRSTSKVIELPMETPTKPMKALFNMCAWAPRSVKKCSTIIILLSDEEKINSRANMCLGAEEENYNPCYRRGKRKHNSKAKK